MDVGMILEFMHDTNEEIDDLMSAMFELMRRHSNVMCSRAYIKECLTDILEEKKREECP